MIQIRHERLVNEDSADNLNTIVGFSLELPEDVDSEAIIKEFAESLQDNPLVFHVVKFEDPLLRAELAERADEIFTLEMKLRRVLSFIYLHAYQLIGPFDLLREETVQILKAEKPTEEQMKEFNENQFFHLTFGQYVQLNNPRQIKQVNDILQVIRDSTQYDDLREKLMQDPKRNPIEHKRDVDLLSDVRALMNGIEQMRNCVAHSRKPTKSIREQYSTTRPLLEERLDRYLADFEISP